jgi:hypothetical protein
VTLLNTTVTGNTSTQDVLAFESRGGGIEHQGASFTIMNSIIAGNSAPSFPEIADCSSPIISLGYNPAVDSGDPAGSRGPDGAPLTTDQRGSRRPSITRCDIGAYELQQTLPFVGFFPLVSPPPTLNPRIGGAPVVVSFRLGGNRGLDIFAPGSPSSRRIDCNSRAPVGPPSQRLLSEGFLCNMCRRPTAMSTYGRRSGSGEHVPQARSNSHRWDHPRGAIPVQVSSIPGSIPTLASAQRERLSAV